MRTKMLADETLMQYDVEKRRLQRKYELDGQQSGTSIDTILWFTGGLALLLFCIVVYLIFKLKH